MNLKAWVETKNKNSKNIICGCIYRHPHQNMNEFPKYLEKCLKKTKKFTCVAILILIY